MSVAEVHELPSADPSEIGAIVDALPAGPAVRSHSFTPSTTPLAFGALAMDHPLVECSRPCWRHGGKDSCLCDDETEGGTWEPGCSAA